MNILEQIIETTIERVRKESAKISLFDLQALAEERVKTRNYPSFAKALLTDFGIIAEVKKASPSKGIISPYFDPVAVAKKYQSGGADAISVLTEPQYFMGHLEYMDNIADQVCQPLLRKDFIIDQYQLYQSVIHSASAVLLIAAALSEQQLIDFLHICNSLNLDALVEVHTLNELETVLKTDACIIGINNRNLTTFETTLETSLNLNRHIPKDIIKISESGIQDRHHILQLQKAGFQAVLIGETLMRVQNPDQYIRYLKGEQNVD